MHPVEEPLVKKRI